MRDLPVPFRLFLALASVAATMLCATGCEDDSDTNPTSYAVEYRVEGEWTGSGFADLEQVTYDDSSGPQILDFDPPLEDWTETVALLPGESFYLRAEGTVGSGRFRLQVTILGDDGSMLMRTNNAMPFDDGPFWVEIPRETLP